MKGKIYIFDDESLLLQYLESHLGKYGFEIHTFSSPSQGLAEIKDDSVDLVLSDVKMPEMTGDEVLRHIRDHHPNTGVILMTGFGSIEHAVNAIQKGAFDYITKPFEGAEILARINRFFKIKVQTGSVTHKADHDFKSAKNKLTPTQHDNSELNNSNGTVDLKLIGNHLKIKQLLEALPQIAQNNAPIFIQGESGTGKEVFASLIHYNSDRSEKPYIKINCANLPRELVESTLFGHVKGAFTGAINDARGAFHEANGGTLLLDEITEIELSVQAKLLRVLQEKEFKKVGSQKTESVDVRVIATSNKNIAQAIKNKEFREDLYYRLNVFPIYIPPLRERKDDIPILANYFVIKFAHEYGMSEKTISKEVIDYLNSHTWKGNVRELSNLIQRGVLMSGNDKEISIYHIKNVLFTNIESDMDNGFDGELPLIPIEVMELKLIRQALERTNGNQKDAAALLGISDRTIRNKLKKLRDE